MLIIGLTGSIAMGKSTTGGQLRRMGVPVHDSDRCVHKLLSPRGRAFAKVAKEFPRALKNREIDRVALGKIVYADPQQLEKLESILHPLVFDETRKWIACQHRMGRRMVALDIPLLFEKERHRVCDVVMVASAPAFLQRQRALTRPNMTPERLKSILAHQLPDDEKRRRADVVIPTGLGLAFSRRALQKAVAGLSQKRGRKWGPGWK